jgi:hypothetical protein
MARRRKRGHFNVEPRYTPGSPAMVDETTALRVARQEAESWEPCKEGFYGEELQAKAEEDGLDLIVFEMVDRPKGWEVYDLITGKEYFWPHKAECPTCKAKKVPCRRGKLEPHQHKSGPGYYYECQDRSFVGHEVSHEL